MIRFIKSKRPYLNSDDLINRKKKENRMTMDGETDLSISCTCFLMKSNPGNKNINMAEADGEWITFQH